VLVCYRTSPYFERHYPFFLVCIGLLVAYFNAEAKFVAILGGGGMVLAGLLCFWVGSSVRVFVQRSAEGAVGVVMLGDRIIERSVLSPRECDSVHQTGTETAMWSRGASDVVRQIRYRKSDGEDALFLDLLALGSLAWSPLAAWRKVGMEEGEHMTELLKRPATIEANRQGEPPLRLGAH